MAFKSRAAPQVFVAPPAEEYEFEVPVPLVYGLNIFEPYTFENSVPKYSFTVTLPTSVYSDLHDMVERIAREAGVKLNSSPLRSGDELLARIREEKEPTDDFAKLLSGNIILRASSQYQITAHARAFPEGPIEVTTDADKFVTGTLVMPVISLRAYKTSLLQGVTAYAQSIYSTGAGKRIGGGGSGPRAVWEKADPPKKVKLPGKVKAELLSALDQQINPPDDDIPF